MEGKKDIKMGPLKWPLINFTITEPEQISFSVFESNLDICAFELFNFIKEKLPDLFSSQNNLISQASLAKSF